MAITIYRPKLPRGLDINIGPKVDGKLSPKGPYLVSVILVRANGEQFRKVAKGLPTKAEARAKRDSFYEEFNILEGGPEYARTLVVGEEPEEPKLGLWAWLDQCVENHWPLTHPQTARSYGLSVKNQIKPFLPDRPLEELKRGDVRSMVHDLLKNGKAHRGGGPLSLSAVKNAVVALGSACSIAIEKELIETNPTHDLGIRWKSLRPHDETERVFLSQDQLSKVLEAAQGLPIYPIVLVQAKLGLRIGEALALKVEDFDLEKKTVRINWQVTRDTASSGKLYPPKSQAGKRTIPVPESVLSFLKGKSGLLMPSESGTFYDHGRAIKAFEEVKTRAELEKFTSHALRHTWISYLLNDCKTPATVVQKLAGHASIITTLSYYSHASEDNAVDAMKNVA